MDIAHWCSLEGFARAVRRVPNSASSFPKLGALQSPGAGAAGGVVAKRIIVHGEHLAGIFVGLHIKRTFNTPLVATIHKTPIGAVCGGPVASLDASYAHLSLMSEWPIDAFIAGREYFKLELGRLGLAQKTHLFHHGIDVQWLRALSAQFSAAEVRDQLQLPRDSRFVICPVRLDPRKRLEDFSRRQQ